MRTPVQSTSARTLSVEGTFMCLEGLVVTANGASAEHDWFTRLSRNLLSNTLICSVDSVTSVLTT